MWRVACAVWRVGVSPSLSLALPAVDNADRPPPPSLQDQLPCIPMLNTPPPASPVNSVIFDVDGGKRAIMFNRFPNPFTGEGSGIQRAVYPAPREREREREREMESDRERARDREREREY